MEAPPLTDQTSPHAAPLAIPRLRPSGVDPHHPCHLLHSGYTVLVTREDGGIDGASRQGLFDFDTRVLSRHRLTIDGRAPDQPCPTVLAPDHWTSALRLRDFKNARREEDKRGNTFPSLDRVRMRRYFYSERLPAFASLGHGSDRCKSPNYFVTVRSA